MLITPIGSPSRPSIGTHIIEWIDKLEIDSLAENCSSFAASADKMPVFSLSTLFRIVRLSFTDASSS